MDLQQQQARAPEDITKTESGEGGAFKKADDLENQLRGMILKNQSPLVSKASAGTVITDSSPSPPKTAEVTPSATKKHGRNDLREDDAHRGRGRRPNQAQRRQMGKIDLNDPPATAQKDARQSGGNVASTKEYRPQQSQIQNAPRSINMLTKAQAQLAQAGQPSQDHQPFMNQQRNVSSRPGILPPPNQQPHVQHPSLVRATVPNLGFRHNPAPFPQHRPMPQHNHMFV